MILFGILVNCSSTPPFNYKSLCWVHHIWQLFETFLQPANDETEFQDLRLKGRVRTCQNPEITESCSWPGSWRVAGAASQSSPRSPYTPSIYGEEDNSGGKESRQDRTVGWWWKWILVWDALWEDSRPRILDLVSFFYFFPKVWCQRTTSLIGLVYWIGGLDDNSRKAEWSECRTLRPPLCDPVDYTVHGVLQARILEWVAFPFSRGSSQPRGRTQISHIAGGFFTSWASWEATWKAWEHSDLWSTSMMVTVSYINKSY